MTLFNSKSKGVPEKKVMPVTEPDTPAITAKRQCLSDGDDSREEETVHVLKANPLPDLNKVFKVELPHRILQAKPFSFEVRDKEKPTRETFVQRILRNEKVSDRRSVLTNLTVCCSKPFQPVVITNTEA